MCQIRVRGIPQSEEYQLDDYYLIKLIEKSIFFWSKSTNIFKAKNMSNKSQLFHWRERKKWK